MPLTIGLYAPNLRPGADAVGAARIAILAESLGYDSLWVADHVVLPQPRIDPSPLESDEPLLDPVVALTYFAARTDRIRLATGCVVLPQRNPLVLAKQLASVDVLSGGRLIFGVGAGYLAPELRALGVPMSGRGARTDEYLRAIRSMWQDDMPSCHGEYVDFDGVDAHPRPLQQPVPVVIGGHSTAAHRRALAHGDEWFGYMLGLRATAEQLDSLRTTAVQFGHRSVPLRISVCPARRLDPTIVSAYAELGVHRLVVAPPRGLELEEMERFVEQNAPRCLGAIPHQEG